MYQGLTKIEVKKWYQNQMKSDTIYYANGQGAMCNSSIEHLNEGGQVIIKAVKASMYNPALELYPNDDKKLSSFMESYKDKSIVGYDICDVSILKVREKIVIGNITKNDRHKQWRRIKFVRRISKKWALKLERKMRREKPKFQKWELGRFANLMDKKCKSL